MRREKEQQWWKWYSCQWEQEGTKESSHSTFNVQRLLTYSSHLKNHRHVNHCSEPQHASHTTLRGGHLILTYKIFLQRCNSTWLQLGYPRITGHYNFILAVPPTRKSQVSHRTSSKMIFEFLPRILVFTWRNCLQRHLELTSHLSNDVSKATGSDLGVSSGAPSDASAFALGASWGFSFTHIALHSPNHYMY